MSTKVETQYVKFWKEDDLMHGVYSKAVDVDISVAREVSEARIKFSEGKSYPLLFDMRGIKSVSKEARIYFADEGAKHISACALIADSAYTKTLADVFVTVNKPRMETRLFDNAAKAKQ